MCSFMSVGRAFRDEARLRSVDVLTCLTGGGTGVAGGGACGVIPYKGINTEIRNSFHRVVRETGRQLVVEKHRHGTMARSTRCLALEE